MSQFLKSSYKPRSLGTPQGNNRCMLSSDKKVYVIVTVLVHETPLKLCYSQHVRI